MKSSRAAHVKRALIHSAIGALLLLASSAGWSLKPHLAMAANPLPSWSTVGGASSAAMGSVHVLLEFQGTVYAGTDHGVFELQNGTWTPMTGGPKGVVNALTSVNGTLYAGTATYQTPSVWQLSAGQWSLMSDSPATVDTFVNKGGTLYAGALGGAADVWKLGSGGWSDLPTSPSLVTGLTVAPDGTLLATSTQAQGGGIWFRYYTGQWYAATGSPGGAETSGIYLNHTLYVGTGNASNGVWMESQKNWTDMSGSPAYVNDLLSANGILYAAKSYGSHGVWAYTEGAWQPLDGSPTNVQGLLYVKATGTLYAASNGGVAGLSLVSDPSGLSANSAASGTPGEKALSRTGWIATGTESSGYNANPPSNAIDGNENTSFSPGPYQTPGQYLEVNMGTAQNFNQIELDSGSHAYDYASGYQVYVSNDGVNWGNPVASGQGSGSPEYISFPAQTAQYIKVVQTGSSTFDRWSVAEFTVYSNGQGNPLGIGETALPRTGWGATGTQTAGDTTDVPTNALDGNNQTRFSTGSVQTPGQYFEVNLGTLQNFNEIDLNSGPSTGDYARGYQVFVSNDGAYWGQPVASGIGTSSPQIIHFHPQTAQYIKIVQTGQSPSNYWSIAEFNVYTNGQGSGIAATGWESVGEHQLSRNGWVATGSQPTASLALDGNELTAFQDGAYPGSYFEVNLGFIQDFNAVVLDNGPLGAYSPDDQFMVEVSKDGQTWSAPVADVQGSSSPQMITFSPQHAKYVKVIQMGYSGSTWGIAEFNVDSNTPGPVPGKSGAIAKDGWSVRGSETPINTSGAPVNALDGNSSTLYSTGLPQTPGQFFEVNMQTPHHFNTVVLDSGQNAADYARSYQVYVSNDGYDWNGPVASGNGGASPEVITFPEQDAQYLDVVQTGSAATHPWSLAKFNVFFNPSPSASGGERALQPKGWVATGTQTPGDTVDVPMNALDANENTRFSTGTYQTPGQYFEVDMGSQQNFNRIVLDSGPSNRDFARGYQVYISNDGRHWGAPIATGIGISSPESISFSPQTARYIKVIQTGSAAQHYWSIASFTVYSNMYPMITTTALGGAQVGVSYTGSLSASGGKGTDAWTATGLPPGLHLSAAGVWSGTPTHAGTYTVTVTVTDSLNLSDRKTYTLNVKPVALAISTTALAGGQVGVAYTETLQANGGIGSDTWSVPVGSSLDGLSLSTGGMISGTPTKSGTYPFTVDVKDAAGDTASQVFTLDVKPVALPTGDLPEVPLAGALPMLGLAGLGTAVVLRRRRGQ